MNAPTTNFLSRKKWPDLIRWRIGRLMVWIARKSILHARTYFGDSAITEYMGDALEDMHMADILIPRRKS